MAYTEDELFAKLERADAAGDAEAAKVIADEIRKVRGSAAPAKAAPARNEWGRAAALAGRNALEGAASTIGFATDPAVVLWNKLTGRQDMSAHAATADALDTLGFPKAENGTERVVGAIERGMAGGAGLVGLARGGAAAAVSPVMRGAFTTAAAGPGQQIIGQGMGMGAGQAAQEAGAGPGGQVAASLFGGLLAPLSVTGGAMTLRGAMRGGETGRNAMRDPLTGKGTIADFRSVGAEPTVGQATGNRRTQGMESLLSASPTSSGVLARAAENQADDIGAGLRNRADALFPNASAERAGRAVEKGVDSFTLGVKATRERLYTEADRHIPPTTAVPLARTQAVLAELSTPNPGAPASTGLLINPKISSPVGHMSKGGIAENIASDLAAARAAGVGGLPYSAVKDIRSRIGQELSDFSLTTDKPTAEYKRLYAALSQDMEEAARAQGPAAMKAAQRANQYYKASADRLDLLERVVDKAGGPEKVYAAVMSGTQDGGTTLRAVMQSLPQDGQRALTAAVIKRMGLATKGNQDAAGDVFSAQTFLTNWNGVSREAKRALFDRHGPRFVADMDKLARVAESIRTGSKVYANPSGTANRGAALTYGASLAGALITGNVGTFGALAGGGLAANGMARWMTNPRFVEWLAKSTELPVGALPQQALMLKGIAMRDDDKELAAFADSLLQQRNNQPDNASQEAAAY